MRTFHTSKAFKRLSRSEHLKALQEKAHSFRLFLIRLLIGKMSVIHNVDIVNGKIVTHTGQSVSIDGLSSSDLQEGSRRKRIRTLQTGLRRPTKELAKLSADEKNQEGQPSIRVLSGSSRIRNSYFYRSGGDAK